MPELKASGDIFTLQGDAAYSEGIVHGRVGAAARITISAELEACHGIDAAIAAEALAEIQGMASVLLPALRAEGSAFARAGANASVQLSPNIFDKVGLTIDLQAQAQAAVAGRIAIGLDFETIAELARGQLSDLAYELFIAFLNELVIEAGVWGRAAFSAMANAHLEVNGSLGSDDDAGFAISAGAGVGWGGGTGWDFYAGLQLTDPKRFYHTASHLISDEVVRQARRQLGPEYGGAISLLDLLLPTALGASFELGQLSALELIHWAGERNDAAPFGKTFQVELQRLIIDKLAEAGGLLLTRMIEYLLPQVSAALVPDARRATLEQDLQTLVDELAEGRVDLARFISLSGLAINVVETIAPSELASWRRPIALMWCALALAEGIRSGARRSTSETGAGASIGVVGTAGVSAHVSLPSMPQPPAAIVPELQRFLSPYPAQLQPSDAIDYLARCGLLPTLLDLLPELADPIDSLTTMLADEADLTPGDLLAAALLGSFGGDLSDTALYQRLRSFAKDSIDDVLLGDLLPALRDALDDNADAALYLREVVEPALRITSGFMFSSLDRLVSASNQPALGDAFYNTFQHGMSAVVYKVMVRNLVVISDILVNHALDALHQGFGELHQDLEDDPNHILATSGSELATLLLPATDAPDAELHAATHQLISDLTAAGVEAFGPTIWSDSRRTELRGLLIRVLESIDTVADQADDQLEAFFEELAECFFIADYDGTRQLLALLGAITADELEVIFRRVIPAMQRYSALLSVRAIDDAQAIATEFMSNLAAGVEALRRELAALAAELNRLLGAVAEAAIDAANSLASAIATLSSDALHDAILDAIRSRGLDAAADLARAVPGFNALSVTQQGQAIAASQTSFLGAWQLLRPLLSGSLAVLGDVGSTASSGLGLTALLNNAASATTMASDEDFLHSVASAARSSVSDAIDTDGITLPPALSLDAIGSALEQTLLNYAPLLQSLAAALLARSELLGLQQALQQAEQDHQLAQQGWQHEQQRHSELRGGALSIEFLSPHPLAPPLADNWIYPAQLPLYLRIGGADLDFVDSSLPQRVVVALNGRPLNIDPAGWSYNRRAHKLILRMPLNSVEHGLIDGLNTIECSVFDGEQQRLHRHISFAVDRQREARAGQLIIAGDLSQFDAPGNDHRHASAEFVALHNAGDTGLDLGGWQVRDRAGHCYNFGQRHCLPGQTLRLHTGHGQDNDTELYWGLGHAVWNNRGDAVYVLDAERNLRAEHVY